MGDATTLLFVRDGFRVVSVTRQQEHDGSGVTRSNRLSVSPAVPQPAFLPATHHAQQRRDRSVTITVQSRPSRATAKSGCTSISTIARRITAVFLDQVFGRDALLNEIIWAYDYSWTSARSVARQALLERWGDLRAGRRQGRGRAAWPWPSGGTASRTTDAAWNVVTVKATSSSPMADLSRGRLVEAPRAGRVGTAAAGAALADPNAERIGLAARRAVSLPLVGGRLLRWEHECGAAPAS